MGAWATGRRPQAMTVASFAGLQAAATALAATPDKIL